MKTLLLRWTLYGFWGFEKDGLYLLKNLTQEQYKSFVKAKNRFVNDNKKDIKGLTDLMNFMGIYTENCDYASIENMSQKDYESKKYEPNLSAEEIFKHLEKICNLEELEEEKEIAKIIEEKKLQYKTACIHSGWFL